MFALLWRCGRCFYERTGQMSQRLSAFLLQLSSARPTLMIDYHFFASCHGYGVYDVVGAQAQRTINHYEIDTKAAIITPHELAEILRRTSNHSAEVAPQPINRQRNNDGMACIDR